MRKYNFKSIIAALVCACSLGFQAKATTYLINSVGNISITSIANNSDNTASGYLVYNNGTIGAAGAVYQMANNGGNAYFNFAGAITNITTLQSGDSVAIPFSVAAGSHFPTVGLTFKQSVAASDGTVIFNKVVQSGNYIYLVVAPTMSSLSLNGEVDFTIQGSAVLSTSNGSTTTLQATTTTYTLNSTQSYVINNAATTLQSYNDCISNPSTSVFAGYGRLYLTYTIACIYNSLLDSLNGTNKALNLNSNSLLNTNLIQVATIAPNSAIVGIAPSNNSATLPTMYYVMANNQSVSSTPVTNFAGTAFTQNTTITDTSMASLEANMSAGQYAIVSYPDGSYAVIVDWGTLLNNVYTQFPSTASVASSDAQSNTLLQQAIKDKLSAMQNMFGFNITYADSNTVNKVPVSITSNLTALLTNPANNGTLSNSTVKNAQTGQTTVKVHYVTLNGLPVPSVPVATTFGYPAGSTTPSNPVQATPASIAGYTQVTDNTILDTMTSIPVASILTTAQSVPYPSTGITDVYYVYEAVPTGLPITGLQLTAQPQANNDVILTWGTLTEINSQTFTVQRSSDGGKTWITINTQPTQAQNGNSSVPLTYQITDLSVPIGSYEYRVIETDIDGSTTTSNVVQIAITGGGQVFPNPASTLLNVKLPASANNVPYRLISADGKIVLKGTITNTGNYGQISVAGIASDIYFLQININNAMQTYEVRIQH